MCKFKPFGGGPFLSFRGGAPNHLGTALFVHQLHTNQIRSYFVSDAYNNYVTMQRMAAGYNNRGKGRLFLEI